MSWITTGAVNLVNGSNVVTGVGSKFLEDARIGDGFRGPNGALYEVTNIPTNTSLTIRPNYEGVTVNAAPYFLVPIEGYVKDSADQLRAATGQIALIPGSKQDKHANLTALSGLTGAADRLPYFTGAGALSLGVLTAKARLLLARADTSGMQTELGLVPVTSSTDAAGGRLATVGWMGMGVPIQMQPTDSADNLPPIAARFIFGNGGVGLPYNFVYIDQFAFGSGSWIRQIAYAVNAPNIWVRFFVAGSATGSAWTPVVLGEKITTLTDTTPGRLLTTGYCGLGSKDNNPYLGNNLNPTDYRTGGSFFGQWLIEGLGLVVGILTVYAASDAQWLGQVIINLNSGALFTRSQDGVAGGVFTAWRRTYNDSNSLNDPQTGGGLMSVTVVSGWTVEKFANGTCILASAFTSASLAANSQTVIDTTIPSVLVGETVAGVLVAALPTLSIDVGAVNAFMVGNTAVRIYARNGTTAQAILFRVKITGRWKT